jgi:hypothetical protein
MLASFRFDAVAACRCSCLLFAANGFGSVTDFVGGLHYNNQLF